MISEDNEADMFSTMVPVEETEVCPNPDSKSNTVKFRYVLSERDYFDSEQLYEGDLMAMS